MNNVTDAEIARAEKVISALHEYCFVSQTLFRRMGYNFTQSDFKCISDIIVNQKAKIEEYEKTAEAVANIALSIKDSLGKLTIEHKQSLSEIIDIFADTLKSLFCPGCEYFTIDICNAIDAVAKRLKEELEHKRETLSNTGGESE